MRFLKFWTRTARRQSRQRKHSFLQVEHLETRLVPYAATGNAWPHPELITLSFVPDGANLGGVYSNLFATFNARFGSAAAWQNQILKAAQVWAQQTNINFAVIGDNGAGIGAGNYQQGDPALGDIRIGGYNFNNANILAQGFMPPQVNNYSIAGDLQFNTAQSFNIGTTYDLFTVAMHEIGHTLGLDHSGIYTADMYAAYGGIKSGLSSDDIAGIQSIYGGPRSPDYYDTLSPPNNTISYATDITSWISTTSYTAVIPNLDLTTTSDVDYYRFTVPAGAGSWLTVKMQSTRWSLLAPKLTIYAGDQVTVLASASGAGQYGATITASVSGLTAGSVFYVKASGADASVFATGKYALGLNMGTGSMPPIPIPTTTTVNGNPLSSGGGHANTVSPEVQANTYTYDNQQTWAGAQTVASDALGNFVVTWSSHNQDGSGWGVYAQRFNVLGMPLGPEFRVNSTTNGDQQCPAVAMDAAGDFVIVWMSNGQDGSGNGIFGQRYDPLGNRVGGEFKVNTYTSDNQMYPSVAMNRLGALTVTWSSLNQDGSGWGVYAQCYSVAGIRLSNEFRVNSTTLDDQEYSSIAMNLAGNFVITWSSHNQDGSGWRVFARQYSAAGLPLGAEFGVSASTTGDQLYPDAAMSDSGFVITWSSQGQDGSGWGIYAQAFSAGGQAMGGNFQVNTTTAGDQEYSSVAMDTFGNFLIAWSSNNQDGSGWGVYMQEYSATGAPLGNETRVNTTTAGDQQFPAVTMNAAGYATVAWSGAGWGDTSAVFVQQYFIASGPLTAHAVGDFFTINGNDDVGVTQSGNGIRVNTSTDVPSEGQAPVTMAPVPELLGTRTPSDTGLVTQQREGMRDEVGSIAGLMAQGMLYSAHRQNRGTESGSEELNPLPDQMPVDKTAPVQCPQNEPALSRPLDATERSWQVRDDSADWATVNDACFANLSDTPPEVTASSVPAVAADSAAAFLAVATLGLGCIDTAPKCMRASLPSIRSALKELVLEIS